VVVNDIIYHKNQAYPRNAMLARYVMVLCPSECASLSVCLSVCHKLVLYRNG